ncbi:MAG TPA: hypothetical protein VFX02_14465 [Gammaproteobacteria bacterium]|nr:hypothetical protein [Gammaproteobacteria bacterium]
MEYHVALSEQAYSLMYVAFLSIHAMGHYSDVKESFADATRFSLGRLDEVERLEKIKPVFRSRFS